MRATASALRVLVVDDDPATLDALEFALTLDGHEVVQASDGVQGLDRVRDSRPDLVIVDWMMPVMDGITMIERLRTQQRLSRLPILMLTAKAMPSNVWAGRRAGVDAYVTKPLDLDLLRREIDRLCRPPSATNPATPDAAPEPQVAARARAAWVAAVSDAITVGRIPLLDVAAAGKLPPSTLSRVLAGTHWPRLDTIMALSAFLDIDLPELTTNHAGTATGAATTTGDNS